MIKKTVTKIIDTVKENPIKTAIIVFVPFGIPLVSAYILYDKIKNEHKKVSKKVDGSKEP
jgi:hypothetical protein